MAITMYTDGTAAVEITMWGTRYYVDVPDGDVREWDSVAGHYSLTLTRGLSAWRRSRLVAAARRVMAESSS